MVVKVVQALLMLKFWILLILQLKNIESTTKNNLINLLSGLIGFKFLTTLA